MNKRPFEHEVAILKSLGLWTEPEHIAPEDVFEYIGLSTPPEDPKPLPPGVVCSTDPSYLKPEDSP